jgi:quercetin dioxygenase-like cupin family protein
MDHGDRLLFLDRRVPPQFQVRQLAVPPGGERAVHEGEWADSLLVVEHGTIELECRNGARRSFGSGDILCLRRLRLRLLRNRGHSPVLVIAISRRR